MGSTSVTATEHDGVLYTNDIEVRGHHFFADEPQSLGGADLGPTPVELLCAGLASCTSITLRMYANRKKWPVEQLIVDVVFEVRVVDGKSQESFIRNITVIGDLEQKQLDRLHQIANKCPVHKILEANAHIKTQLS